MPSHASATRAAVVAAVAVAVAGCGGDHVIPYRADLRPGPIPVARNVPPVPRGARRCRPPSHDSSARESKA